MFMAICILFLFVRRTGCKIFHYRRKILNGIRC